jgi:zinc finger-like protein
LCGKALCDLTEYNALLDDYIAQNPMPEEYAFLFSLVACADCEKRSVIPFHFVYHKCGCCGSYNTKVIEDRVAAPPEAQELSLHEHEQVV